MPSSLYKISISESALEKNIEILTKNLSSYLPVVKANAYGHGIVDVAKLCTSYETAKKLAGFAVGIVSEGALLRENNIKEKILVLMGADPFHEEREYSLAKEHNLTLLAHDEDSLRKAVEADIPFALKWNTGMNRFGFSEEDVPALLDYLRANKKAKPEFDLSHFAISDDTKEESVEATNSQIKKFNFFKNSIEEYFPHVQSSLEQSAYILAHNEKVSDVGRLGIAMYGANPLYKTSWEECAEKLRPVMTVSAPILKVRTVKAGEGIGYGLYEKANHDREVAIVGIGYDDGYRRLSIAHRQENNIKIQALFNGKRVNLLGQVCMQMSFFDVSGLGAKTGDEVILMGGNYDNAILAEELTAWWGTLAYEAFCLFGKTDNREYIE